jgi:hypothetical protein
VQSMNSSVHCLLKRMVAIMMRLILRLLEWLCWMLVCLVAMCVLAWAVLSDAFQEKPVEPPKPTRKLPIPIRQGKQIFVIMPDDSRVEVEPLAAATHARAWLDVVAGGYVRSVTELPE